VRPRVLSTFIVAPVPGFFGKTPEKPLTEATSFFIIYKGKTIKMKKMQTKQGL
jgi:hypothetical protein